MFDMYRNEIKNPVSTGLTGLNQFYSGPDENRTHI